MTIWSRRSPRDRGATRGCEWFAIVHAPFRRHEPSPSEPPGKISLDRVVLRVGGELADIKDADLGLRAELQIPARLDERRVARDRDAPHAERRAGGTRRERTRRLELPEG